MTLTDFKKRYIESLPDVPEDLRDELGLESFVTLDADAADELKLPKYLYDFLTTVGLPESASPWLSFDFDLDGRIAAFEKYPHMIPIGSNGSGDDVCLDSKDNYAVVYLNHDEGFQCIFINSSVLLLAECLCLYLGHRHRKDPSDLLNAIGRIDPGAIEVGTFWYTESLALESDE